MPPCQPEGQLHLVCSGWLLSELPMSRIPASPWLLSHHGVTLERSRGPRRLVGGLLRLYYSWAAASPPSCPQSMACASPGTLRPLLQRCHRSLDRGAPGCGLSGPWVRSAADAAPLPEAAPISLLMGSVQGPACSGSYQRLVASATPWTVPRASCAVSCVSLCGSSWAPFGS